MTGASTLGRSSRYHRHFTALRGVDFSSDPSEVSRSRFSLLENMWCDPKSEDGVATETFPGFRVFARLSSPIHGIYRHRVLGEDYLVVHAGKSLYRFPEKLRNFEATLSLLAPLPVTVGDKAGCAFSYGDAVCLLIDGEYLMIDAAGNARLLSEDASLAYVPVTYYNGERLSQRNLLSDRVRLVFTADGPYEDAVTEDGLVFTVFNEEEKTCSVRISKKYARSGRVDVPATAIIGTEKYTVKAVAANGFAGMAGLVSVTLPPTVTILGAYAFFGDTALTEVNLPSSLETIGVEAFFGCLSLEGISVGKRLHLVGRDAFGYCHGLKEVRYAGSETEYAAIVMEGENTLRDTDATVLFGNDEPYESEAVLYRYPLYEPCLSVEKVTLDDTPLGINFTELDGALVRYSTVSTEDTVTHLELTATKGDALKGRTVTVWATVRPIHFSLPTGYAPMGEEGRRALLGCTAVGKYDGRVFFTGNPLFPNTVFYSAIDETGVNNPFYVGCLNYFNDGTGAVPNRGFAVTGGLLAVLKADAGGEGEIFFHRPADTGEDLLPRVYPTVATAPGTGLAGVTVRYADEALFLGREGLYAISRCENESERALSKRSRAVDLRLLSEATEDAQAAVFEGLLYLLCNGNAYIADSRRASSRGDYDWYFLTGIGAYAGDNPVYRYTAYLPDTAGEYSLVTHPRVGERAEGEIYSATLSDGTLIYYAENGDGRFPVDTDGERAGGRFSAANRLCATDEALYFGTPDGAIGCFNTDKRGLSIYRTMKSELYILEGESRYVALSTRMQRLVSEDMVERRMLYAREGTVFVEKGEGTVYLDGDRRALALPLGEAKDGNRVHRHYYSYAGHAYTARCALAMDDGGIPHLAKDTLPLSAAVKLKTVEGGRVSVFVRTDRHPFRLVDTLSAATADAGDTDFSAFDFHSDTFATLPLREKERGWCYKQYLFEGGKYAAPFGIYSLSYSFSPVGRIKA